jgi:hypothetical protein
MLYLILTPIDVVHMEIAGYPIPNFNAQYLIDNRYHKLAASYLCILKGKVDT